MLIRPRHDLRMAPISASCACPADFRVFKIMGLSVACSPLSVANRLGLNRYKAVVYCLITYVEFSDHSNIKMGLSDP
jgi:hypothetical protein